MSKVTDDELLELDLRSDPRVLPGVRDSLAEWLLARDWTAHQAAEITLAVDEALSNIIRHGYECDANHRILLNVSVLRGGQEEGVEIRLRDFGKQCDPAQIRGRPLEEVRPGGLGVHIIRAMMTSVEYSAADGGGMLLVMKKHRGHTAVRR